MIVGGSGHVGSLLVRHLVAEGQSPVVVSRRPGPEPGARFFPWDGSTLGPWAAELDGADAVINLAGRSVDCRYTRANLDAMMRSRVETTELVGRAIRAAVVAPRVWVQASTATIYAHRFDAPNDEATGLLGGGEPGSDTTWDASIAIAKAWEAALEAADTPGTRKVAVRSAMTMSIDQGSVFDVLVHLARRGLGGTLAGGRQFVSWIHEGDFYRSIRFLVDHPQLVGKVNVCAPTPLPQGEFAASLRKALGVRFGLPTSRWMIELRTWALRTESELVLKSRRVVPARLLEAGFEFHFPSWPDAARDLVSRLR